MSKDADIATGTRVVRGAFEPVLSGRGAVISAGIPPKRSSRKRIVVVGEFNSGKTTLVNTLVGAPVLTPGIMARTAHPTIVSYRAKPALSAEAADRRRRQITWGGLDGLAPGDICRLHVGARLERLKGLSVVDTPGLGFTDDENDRRSLQACRSADVVIWCTPAMQAWKASEERTWLGLPERVRARGVLAVTFTDAIDSEADVGRLMQRLNAEAGPHFRTVVAAGDCRALV